MASSSASTGDVPSTSASGRLLSIQSHVSSGYVGNRSATFPLQLLGWDVDVINTVQFSNHTGYGRWKGLRFDEEHVRSIFQGLEENGLLKQERILTGYMPSPGVVQAVKEAVEKIKAIRPDVVFLCDPVMGDMGRGMYVDPAVLPVYKSMLPLTSIITPNQFEAQALADQEVTSLASLHSVLSSLHTQGASHVLITSVDLPVQDLERIGADPSAEKTMILVGSSRPEDGKTPVQPWFIQFPEIPGYFSGVGDLFAALVLGRFSTATKESITPIARAAELSIASVQGVLARTQQSIAASDTQDATRKESEDPAQARVDMMRGRELRIIQSRSEIENPGQGARTFTAKFFKAEP
jgi:pyridoxine kinase